jgi:hypothetical protein
MTTKSSKLRVGDWVEVRSKDEILRTLDSNGELDGMPFMPEMLAFCGKRFRVYKRAHKTCDTVFPVRGRRVESAVHLETRCDGSAHGGCQAGCLIFWKDAWLKPISGKSSRDSQSASGLPSERLGTSPVSACTEATVWSRTHTIDPEDGLPQYVCQATRLPYATTSLEWWEFSQYAEDYFSGNVGLWQIICGAVFFFCDWIGWVGIGVGRPLRWLHDNLYPLWRGTPYPRRRGVIPLGQTTPAKTLDLQPGELVRIKPLKEILNTLDTSNRNRGLLFDAEEVPFCGGTYRVQKRVTEIINERTGKMRKMKSPCIVLDDVFCLARYSECRLFCPRSIYSYWKEIWLERVDSKSASFSLEAAGELASPSEPASDEQELRVSRAE